MTPETLSRPWLAQALRLTVFPVSPWEAPADLWQAVVGEAPETDQNQPKQFIRTQTGPWQDCLLQVVATPLRIDWVLSPVIRSNNEVIGPDLKPLVDVWALFVRSMRGWLNSTSCEVKRIAFGTHGLLAAPDRIASYRTLQELLPRIPIQPENSSDFVYQINHQVGGTSGVDLNRLTRWNGLAFRLILADETGAQSGSVLFSYFASLECDHSTSADYSGTLDKGLLVSTYNQLAQLVWENLEAGEIV